MLNMTKPEVSAMNRIGEKEELPDRKSRLFLIDDYWYYSTREGIDIGPFDTKHEAESGISDFIDFIIHAEPQVIDSLNKYRPAA